MSRKLYDPQIGSGEKNRWFYWLELGLITLCAIVALMATNGRVATFGTATPATAITSTSATITLPFRTVPDGSKDGEYVYFNQSCMKGALGVKDWFYVRCWYEIDEHGNARPASGELLVRVDDWEVNTEHDSWIFSFAK